MSRRPKKISELAAEAGLDLDEVLVALWDAGIESVDSPRDSVPARQVSDAYRALGLTAPNETASITYWLELTGLSRGELTARAALVGVVIPKDSRRLPKGGARRLARLFPASGMTLRGLDTDPVPPMKWEIIGREAEVRCLSEGEVLQIHEALEKDFAESNDPIFPTGIKDMNLLSSACMRPNTGMGSSRKYPTIEMATAALFHSVTLNHAFHNGNKRTALVSLLAQLDENGLVLTASQDELFRMTLKTAQHGLVQRHADLLADREVLEVSRWIRANSRPIEKGERPLKWLRLKQRLADFDCKCESTSRVGNRLNISREMPIRKRPFMRQRVRTLTSHVAWSGDGTEASKSTIHKIRRDLELDEEHNVDSRTFYSGMVLDSFIIEYRRILARLSKL